MKLRSDIRNSRARVVSFAFWSLLVFALSAGGAVSADPGDDVLARGKTQYESGDYANAVQTLIQYVSLYSSSTVKNLNAAKLYLGCSYLMLHNGEVVAENDQARRCFADILNQGKSAPYFIDASFHNARSYYMQKEFPYAKRLLGQFLSEYNQTDFTPYVYYYLGICEEETGMLQNATAYFDEYLRRYGATDSVLKWYCMLEKATVLGKLGQYDAADAQLEQLGSTQGVPVEVAGKAAILRALLMFTRKQYDKAFSVLEDYIIANGSNPDAKNVVQEATIYEAYAYFAKGEFQRALLIVDRLEDSNSTTSPEAAMLKIKLYLNMKDVAKAENLLNQFAVSEYGQTHPDVVTTYRAMINLAKKDRDAAINSLAAMLMPRRQSENSSAIVFDYLNMPVSGTRLEPLGFVEACGVLTIAYAGRYGHNPDRKQPQTMDPDYNAQEALYQAIAQYANEHNEPRMTLTLQAIDQGRKRALSNTTNQSDNITILSPGYNSSSLNTLMAPGGFTNPTDPNQFQNPGFQQTSPSVSGYTPNSVAQNGSGDRLPLPSLPNNTPTTGTNPATGTNPTIGTNPQLVPNQGTTAANSNANVAGAAGPNAQTQNNVNPSAQAQNNANVAPLPFDPAPNNANPQTNSYVGQQQTAYVNPNGQPTTAGAAYPSGTPEEPTKLTEAEVKRAIRKATEYYRNGNFDRANEVLLETMTKSTTLWQDHSADAARLALLRANALFELEMYDEALMMCRNVVYNAPNTDEAAVANFYLGSYYDSLGEQEEAVRYLKAATAGNIEFPLSDVALYYLGCNEYERGNVRDATHVFDKLCRNYPNSAYWSHAVWRLAKIESDRGNDVTAEKLVNEALGKQPDANIIDYLLFLKGEIALRAKDYDKALIAFDMIVDQYPDSVWLARAKNRIAAVPPQFKGVEYSFEDERIDERAEASPMPPGAAPPPRPNPPAATDATRSQTATDDYPPISQKAISTFDRESAPPTLPPTTSSTKRNSSTTSSTPSTSRNSSSTSATSQGTRSNSATNATAPKR